MSFERIKKLADIKPDRVFYRLEPDGKYERCLFYASELKYYHPTDVEKFRQELREIFAAGRFFWKKEDIKKPDESGFSGFSNFSEDLELLSNIQP